MRPETSDAAIRVLVVDDDPLVRSASKRMLAETEDITAEAGDGDAALDQVTRAGQRLRSLTPAERAIASAVAQGHSNAGIAKQLHPGQSTVKTHISSLHGQIGPGEPHPARAPDAATNTRALTGQADP